MRYAENCSLKNAVIDNLYVSAYTINLHMWVDVSRVVPWIDVFASPEKINMAVTESDLDPKVRKMSITF